jgi:hypothetical protein
MNPGIPVAGARLNQQHPIGGNCRQAICYHTACRACADNYEIKLVHQLTLQDKKYGSWNVTRVEACIGFANKTGISLSVQLLKTICSTEE